MFGIFRGIAIIVNASPKNNIERKEKRERGKECKGERNDETIRSRRDANLLIFSLICLYIPMSWIYTRTIHCLSEQIEAKISAHFYPRLIHVFYLREESKICATNRLTFVWGENAASIVAQIIGIGAKFTVDCVLCSLFASRRKKEWIVHLWLLEELRKSPELFALIYVEFGGKRPNKSISIRKKMLRKEPSRLIHKLFWFFLRRIIISSASLFCLSSKRSISSFSIVCVVLWRLPVRRDGCYACQ